MAVIFFLEVLCMFCVLGLNVTNPGKDGESRGDANEKADPAPEGSRA